MIAWLKSLWAKFQAVGYAEEGNHFCPVCGYRTITRDHPHLHVWNICGVCFWEDDDWFDGGGANHVTLSEARANFAQFGAVEERLARYVRPPRPETPRIVPRPILTGESK